MQVGCCEARPPTPSPGGPPNPYFSQNLVRTGTLGANGTPKFFLSPLSKFWKKILLQLCAFKMLRMKEIIQKCPQNLKKIKPPPPPCRPKFQPPQSEGAGRGLVPLGDQETGEQAFCCPPPPPTEMGPKAGPAQPPPPPPPSMPSHPRTLTAGRHMVIKVPPLTDRERTPNDGYVGIWDPHGNPAGGPPLPNK